MTQNSVEFDHLVIGAADLDSGRAWAQATLGADPPLGGAHPMMGTHNRLARLPVGYLEIIAVDPTAPPPSRPRWYGLDAPEVRRRMTEKPRPVGWVLAVNNLEAAVARASWDPGKILTLSRDDLTWRMAVAPDGRLVEGVLPLLIEWPARLGRRAPTERMVDLGLALRELKLRHPEPARIREALESVGAADAVARAGVALSVEPADHDQALGSIEAIFISRNISLTL